MKWVHDDGGRAAAGFRGTAPGDCAVRAAAIATGLPYKEVYDAIAGAAVGERIGSRKLGISHPRTGVWQPTFRKYMTSIGWVWTPTMFIGSGCKVHLRAEELPPGRIICNVSRHYTAVIDRVIHDLFDPSRGGNRCVYGYYYLPRAE